ncbi:MAG TPA: hypothetical protein VEA18_02820 [Candidatus Kapabacteria bacterium]|nr:hypothetical protein [Candidatus Kapabacteria bacterium]
MIQELTVEKWHRFRHFAETTVGNAFHGYVAVGCFAGRPIRVIMKEQKKEDLVKRLIGAHYHRLLEYGFIVIVHIGDAMRPKHVSNEIERMISRLRR